VPTASSVPRDVEAGNVVPLRLAPHDHLVAEVDRRRMHTNERVAVPERGPVDLRELQRLESAVPVLDDRLHRDLLI
jgi:hypothetical protein